MVEAYSVADERTLPGDTGTAVSRLPGAQATRTLSREDDAQREIGVEYEPSGKVTKRVVQSFGRGL